MNFHQCGQPIGDRGVDWANIDSSKWHSDHMEIAKCFNPQWSGGKAQNNIKDDLSVFIGRVINCREIRNLFHNNCPSTTSIDPEEIRKIRNNVHHGPNELSIDVKEDYFNKILAFLQTPCLWVYQETREAFKKIEIFKNHTYRDIIKDKVIDEHELKRMENRISQSWQKCYSLSILSIAMVIILMILPLVVFFIQEIIDLLYLVNYRITHGQAREKNQDESSASGGYSNNISTVSLLLLIILMLVPLVILSLRELRKTRYYAYIEIFFERLFTGSAWQGQSVIEADFVTREEWGANEAKTKESMPTPVGNVFVHHTGGPFYNDKESCSKRVKYIKYLHMDANKWDDIGYNFLIGEDGRIYEGRGWTTVGAHTFGWNRNSVCFAFMGDFNERAPNTKAIHALQYALKWGVENKMLSPTYTLYGHCDKRTTDSPGRYLYAIIRYFDHFHKYINL